MGNNREIMKGINIMENLIKRCLDLKAEIKNLTLKLEALKETNIQSMAISGMPKTRNRADISDIIVKQEEIQQEIYRKEIQLLEIQNEIEDIITPLSSRERLIIRWRLEGVAWEIISKKIDYSIRHSKRIYQEALTKIS